MAATPRTLTQRELNRALLARQSLLERAELPVPRVLERIGGIQAQYAPSMYVGVWSRVAGFARDDLTRALERRSVVQGTLMRATIHLVSARDYWPFAVGLRPARGKWALTVRPGALTEGDLAAASRALARRLRKRPLRRAEVDAELGKDRAPGVLMGLDLVRVPPSGTWERRRADLFGAAEDWLGPADATPGQGLELLVRRYLSGFGPASRADVASWAGLTVTELAPAFDSLGLRRFRAEDGAELLDLPRAPLPDPDTPAPVRFLPTWDAALLVHARRTQILPERYRPLVFSTKTPHSVGTFLVGGAVAGSWRHERGRVLLEPFGRLDRAVRRELAEEAERLAAFHT